MAWFSDPEIGFYYNTQTGAEQWTPPVDFSDPYDPNAIPLPGAQQWTPPVDFSDPYDPNAIPLPSIQNIGPTIPTVLYNPPVDFSNPQDPNAIKTPSSNLAILGPNPNISQPMPIPWLITPPAPGVTASTMGNLQNNDLADSINLMLVLQILTLKALGGN